MTDENAPEFGVQQKRSKSPFIKLTPSYMNALKFFWAFTWRTWLLSLLLGVSIGILSSIAGFENLSVIVNLISIFLGLFSMVWVIKRLLEKGFGRYRIVMMVGSDARSFSKVIVNYMNAVRFSWAIYWRMFVFYLLSFVPIGILLLVFKFLFSQFQASVLIIIMAVFLIIFPYLFVNLWVLKRLFEKGFGKYRVMMLEKI